MKQKWNERHPNNKITTDNEREIWEELSHYMSEYLCENEKCWLRKLISDTSVTHKLLTESFAPSMPEHWKDKPRAWLSDLDISRVMKQYEHAFNDFLFLGPSPIDFDACDTWKKDWVWPELKFFDLAKYIEHEPNNYNKIGIVFNLDTHEGEGTHWVSLYIDITCGKIYYFDSNGNVIPSRIKRLVDTIKKQGKEKNIHFTLSQNYPNEHQKQNTECGVYVIFFLIHMLKYNDWSLFKHGKISDDIIFQYRSKFYNQ